MNDTKEEQLCREEGKVRSYGENTNACRHWCGRGPSSTSENLSFSTDGSVVSIRENEKAIHDYI